MLDKKLIREENVAWRIIEGEAVLIASKDSSVHSLSDVGTRIWQLADGNLTVGQIVDALNEEYEVEKDELEKDVIEFVESLSAEPLALVRLEDDQTEE